MNARRGVVLVSVLVCSLLAPATASGQLTFAHNYVTPACCGDLRAVRSAITLNDLDTAGEEALARVIARSSSNLTFAGQIQAGYAVTKNVYPVPNQICEQTTGTGQPYQFWASQPSSGGPHFCHLSDEPASDGVRHKYKVTRVTGSSTYWRVYRDDDPWSSTRDVGFNTAGFVGAGGRLTSDDELNDVSICYGCGSNTMHFQRSHEVCCGQSWTTISSSFKRQDPGWFIGDVPTPFTLAF